MSDKDLPAFPVVDPFAVTCPPTEKDALQLQRGMTLRDYFAAKAMQADIAGLSRHLHQYDGNELRIKAESAYQMADAMLEARKA